MESNKAHTPATGHEFGLQFLREREQAACCAPAQNVADTERLLSGLAAGGLIGIGLVRRGLPGIVMTALGGMLAYRAASGHCSIYQMLGIDTSQSHSPVVGVPARSGFKHETSMLIHRPATELFGYWRNLSSLPQLFPHLVSVTESEEGKSHWVARGPLGQIVEWDALVHNERPGEMIAWRSVPGSDLDTAGSIHFEPTEGDSTLVTLTMKYNPRAGKIGATIADWLGEGMEQEVESGLERFKQIVEFQKGQTTQADMH